MWEKLRVMVSAFPARPIGRTPLLALVALLGCCGRGTERTPPVARGAEPGLDAGTEPGEDGDLPAPPADPNLVAAGRALEAGEPSRARALLPVGDPRPEARWLAARIAVALEEHAAAVTLIEGLDGAPGVPERRRLFALVTALAAAGRAEEALARSQPLLAGPDPLPRPERLTLREQRGVWLEELDRPSEALSELDAARELAARPRDRERLDLRRAELLIRLERVAEARRIAGPLAESAASAASMRRAESLLARTGQPAERVPGARLARARRFAELRAFDDALAELTPLLDGAGPLRAEARFERARFLFDRRRHYSEAAAALEELIAEGGARADEARLLRARALSRLDRDEEAVAAYLDFARRTADKGGAANARFQAARLLYYLGRHGEAVRELERLVGNGAPRGRTGQRLRPGRLTPDQARDAHFLAGMSALLDGKPARAEGHLLTASEGSGSAEAVERNRYWFAVARLEGRRGDGPDLLRDICAASGTSWYAAWARSRLAEAGLPPGACDPQRLLPQAAGEEPGAETPDAASLPAAIEPLSPLAGFFARAGLYRDAAAELSRAEEGASPKDRRPWIQAYVALDAPHLAIRAASRGLGWPPAAGELWKARAAYPEPFLDLTRRVEVERDLPRHLIAAIARKESLFDPRAVSGVGAMGMLQMMPQTWETNRVRAGLPPLAPGELPGPEASIQAAGFELEWLLGRFGGCAPLAIMGYNGGAAAVARWLERSGGLPMDVFVEKASFGQTRNYVRRVWQNLVRYRLLHGEPLPELPALAERAAPSPPAGLPTPDGPATPDSIEDPEQTGERDD
jgi:soluble lytic murein transglycosylase